MIEAKRILVVDADRGYATRLCTVLKKEQFMPLGPAPTAFYAEQLLGRRKVDAVIIDAGQLGMPALKFAAALASRGIAVLPFGGETPSGKTIPDKPGQPEEIVAMLRGVLGMDGVSTGETPKRAARQHTGGPVDYRSTMARTISRVLRSKDTASPQY